MQKTHRPNRAPTRKIAGIAGTNLNRSEIGTFNESMHLSVYSSQALFHSLLRDPVAALCNGNDPDWRRHICGTEQRYIGLVI